MPTTDARRLPHPRHGFPRPTARLRLTLLYGALFTLCGAALLTITYLLVQHAIATVTLPNGVKFSFGKVIGPGRLPSSSHQFQAMYAGTAGHASNLTSTQVAQLEGEATQLHAFDTHELLIGSAIALGLMTIVSVVLGWFIAGRVLRPVRTISATARDIGASNLHERLNLDGPDDEFRELASTLDGLLERLEASFDSQRRFVANASHELKTPLTLDRSLLESALAAPATTAESWRRSGQRLLATNKQQAQLIDALLTLARSQQGLSDQEHIDLAAIAEDVIDARDYQVARRGLSVHPALDPTPMVGDPDLVESLVANLVDNAVRYNQPQGRVDITARTDSGHAVLSVSNTGPMIPEDDVDRLFQPFERLSPNRSGQRDGAGLGLSIVKAIADAHEATVTATPRPDGGLKIEVTFPLVVTGSRLCNDQHRSSPSNASREPSAHAPEVNQPTFDGLLVSSSPHESTS